MGSCTPEIVHDVPPYIRVYADGTVERLVATEVAPAGFDPDTGVFSKDVIVNQETGVTARLYRPNTQSRLPLVIYFHGGAFCVATAFEPKYHNFVNKLVSEANVMAISVDYRRVPEYPLSAAYEDSWEVLNWVSLHNNSSGEDEGSEDWIRDGVDFGKVFLAGDSAGANISHHMAIRAGTETGVTSSIISSNILEFRGIIMIHPYFWGEKPVGFMEIKDPIRKSMVDKWWKFVCPSDKGCDDPLINPFVNNNDNNSYELSADHSNLGCKRILIWVAEDDILNERGKMYYRSLIRSKNWNGKAEMVETEGEDHVFHIFNPSCEKAEALVKKCAAFLNQV